VYRRKEGNINVDIASRYREDKRNYKHSGKRFSNKHCAVQLSKIAALYKQSELCVALGINKRGESQ
jgi:hypothetical protein